MNRSSDYETNNNKVSGRLHALHAKVQDMIEAAVQIKYSGLAWHGLVSLLTMVFIKSNHQSLIADPGT